MALAGAWQNTVSGTEAYSQANKQGNGWNPIHAQWGGTGRNAKNVGPVGSGQAIDPSLTDSDFQPDYADSFTDEDFDPSWGYGPESPRETGVHDRPEWGNSTEDNGYMPRDYPAWGGMRSGISGGSLIRSKEKGAIASLTPNQVPVEDVAQGWRNKETGIVEDAEVSDESQYIMQTSMVQRDKTRAGSQISGTASEQDAPIRSRITGQRLKFWSGEQRHVDMTPKTQDEILRPFWLRTAGIGRINDMAPNEMYRSSPLQRTPPEDPYQGPTNGDGVADLYGFTAEDATW